MANNHINADIKNPATENNPIAPSNSAFKEDSPSSTTASSQMTDAPATGASVSASATSTSATSTTTPGDATATTPSSAAAPAEAPTPEPHYLLTIDEGVVEKVASLAAKKVDGIIDMKGGVLSMIQEGLGGNDRRKGVTANVLDEESVKVELSVILEYGKSALGAFDELKRAITDDVKKMTSLNVIDMTVNIVDVMDRDEFDRKRGGASPVHDANASEAGNTTDEPDES